MPRTKYDLPPRDIFDSVDTRLKSLERRVKQLENLKNPTVPITPKNDANLIPGQIFITPGGLLAWKDAGGTVRSVSG